MIYYFPWWAEARGVVAWGRADVTPYLSPAWKAAPTAPSVASAPEASLVGSLGIPLLYPVCGRLPE
jgi:hypothetical protein